MGWTKRDSLRVSSLGIFRSEINSKCNDTISFLKFTICIILLGFFPWPLWLLYTKSLYFNLKDGRVNIYSVICTRKMLQFVKVHCTKCSKPWHILKLLKVLLRANEGSTRGDGKTKMGHSCYSSTFPQSPPCPEWFHAVSIVVLKTQETGTS